MFFSVGQKVILKYTRDEGVVTEVHRDGMVVVRLDGSDMEIPIFEEDLEYHTVPPLHKSPNLPKKPTPSAPVFQVETQYNILHSMGLQLAFEAVMKYENVEKYSIYIINDTESEVIFVLRLCRGEDILFEIDQKIGSMALLYVGELFYDELLDVPEVEIEAREVTTEGVGALLTKVIKLKPQTFHKNYIMAPLLDKMVHHFVLFENFTPPKTTKKANQEDLKTYTKRNAQPKAAPTSLNVTNARRLSRNEIEEYANFSPELDLHIENLMANISGMTNGEILNIQLTHFDCFMQKALRLGVPRVFIIHGVGKGKLRDAVTTKLLQEYDIETFRNEYHPKYGFGATEVIF